ncbi:MAG: UvrB/UvrC motif-containing protein [Clostridia bacterium]|nr:UvrB/UvrC motif-containing protein [Clostridia bacterium]
MLCEKCKKNQATTHISSTVNGLHIEKNLCAACAAQEGFTELGGGLFSMLSSMFGEGASAPGVGSGVRCSLCGKSFADIAETGRLGCAGCYKTFARQLSSSLQRIHGTVKHIGKRSKYKEPQETKAGKIEKLKAALQTAIAQQAFEQAAELRDEIKKLEAEQA